ncbi:hypothetical protein [Bradyrhizobium brasilense]|nr:hypothetical protein [Bradyrhizobium brasilense]
MLIGNLGDRKWMTLAVLTAHHHRGQHRSVDGERVARRGHAVAEGTSATEIGFALMSELLPVLVEKSIQIAWDFLERSGEIIDPDDASRFLLKNIDDMARAGEHRPLMLANNAIDAYRRYRRLLAA